MLCLTSCYEATGYPDKSGYNARITIHEPVEGDVVQSGNYILLKSTFENNDKIENIEITLTNITTGDTVYYINKHPASDLYYFVNEEILIDAEPGDELQLTSSTWNHHPENKIADTVYLSVQ